MSPPAINPDRLPTSATTLTKYLQESKTRFSPADTAAKLAVLGQLRRTAILDPKVLLRYHEALLFIRAYPDDRRIFSLVCKECSEFIGRVTRLRAKRPGAAEELEDTGIVDTGMYYSYDYAVVIWLVKWYGHALDIDWDEFEATDKIDRLLPLFCEWAENDGLDLADISTRDWLELRHGGDGKSSLVWLLESLERTIPSYSQRMQLYDSLDLPIVWQLGDSPAARTHAGSRARPPFYHQDGLLKRVGDFRRGIAKQLRTIHRAPPRQARALLKSARSTLAVRHRALYPLDYASLDEVLVADVGRGYQIILFGMEPARRLPIESDYGVLVMKNGFIFGYGVGAILFDQVEIAVNIFEAWRGGESRYVFTQFVRTFRSHFGCNRFKIERYQVGYENEEGIESGSFWFYYHLGFVPKVPEVRRLAECEQAKIDKNRAYRSPRSVLEKLALSDLYLTLDGKPRAIPDDFPVADLSLKVTRMIGERYDGDGRAAVAECTTAVADALRCPRWTSWPKAEQESFRRLSLIVAQIPNLSRWSPKDKKDLITIIRAKGGPEESGFVRKLARHDRLRKALDKVARA